MEAASNLTALTALDRAANRAVGSSFDTERRVVTRYFKVTILAISAAFVKLSILRNAVKTHAMLDNKA